VLQQRHQAPMLDALLRQGMQQLVFLLLGNLVHVRQQLPEINTLILAILMLLQLHLVQYHLVELPPPTVQQGSTSNVPHILRWYNYPRTSNADWPVPMRHGPRHMDNRPDADLAEGGGVAYGG